jgi:hypothetical protein
LFRMIRGHEGGEVRLNWHADGLACEITFSSDLADDEQPTLASIDAQ